jgi:hypothetical protein
MVNPTIVLRMVHVCRFFLYPASFLVRVPSPRHRQLSSIKAGKISNLNDTNRYEGSNLARARELPPTSTSRLISSTPVGHSR